MKNYFSDDELKCQETGELDMDPVFLAILNSIRMEYGKPMIITSGYRSVWHSIERAKLKPGSHTKGLAVDVACGNSEDRFRMVSIALEHGVNRIGIADTFIHLDMDEELPQEVMWVYK